MGFVFNDVTSKSMGITARLTNWSAIPALRENTETIPGKAGVIDFGAEYGARYIDVSCCIFPKASFAALVSVLDGIAEWLDPTTGEHQLILDDVPNRYFWARLSAEINCERLIRSSGTFDLRFVCADPYAYAIKDDAFKITALNTPVSINRTAGNTDSTPIYRLSASVPAGNTNNIRIDTNGSALNIIGVIPADKILEIDSEKLTAKILNADGSVYGNGLSCMQELNFPKLHKGENTITITQNGEAVFTELQIQARSRWK